MWVVDQRVTRPGPTPPPRKRHLIYRFHISPDIRETLAEQELDELPDASHEVGVIEWIDYRKTAELPIFPPIGPALADPHAPSPTRPHTPSPTRTTPGCSARMHRLGAGPTHQPTHRNRTCAIRRDGLRVAALGEGGGTMCSRWLFLPVVEREPAAVARRASARRCRSAGVSSGKAARLDLGEPSCPWLLPGPAPT